jgi:hypothetical protein
MQKLLIRFAITERQSAQNRLPDRPRCALRHTAGVDFVTQVLAQAAKAGFALLLSTSGALAFSASFAWCSGSPSFTLTYSATVLAGLSINAQTGVISGTPTDSDFGTNPITVTATDTRGCAMLR